MPFVQAKCPECGGMLAVDDSKKAANCQFCGEAFIVQEAINNYITNNITNNNTTHNYGDGAVVNVYDNQNSISSLLKRAFMFLEDSDFVSADEYCDKVLDIEPENVRAYFGKLMVDLKIKNEYGFNDINVDFNSNNNYQKVLAFGDENIKDVLTKNLERIKKNLTEIKQREEIEEEKRKQKIKERREVCSKFSMRIIACDEYTIGVKSDGNLVCTSKLWATSLSRRFKNIVAISTGCQHTVGLKSDGTVVADGSNEYGQCDVSDWRNIVAISAGDFHTVGLKSDGTVVITKLSYSKSLIDKIFGNNGSRLNFGQCDIENWTDIVAISAGSYHTVGLKSDGTVVAVGKNDYGQCNVSCWADIVAIFAGYSCTYGIKSNGTVVAVGGSSLGGISIGPNWTNIVAISAGTETIALKSDGTVVDEGVTHNDYDEWKDIVAISASRGRGHTVGLKSDGTVVAKGNNDFGQCKIEKWKLF